MRRMLFFMVASMLAGAASTQAETDFICDEDADVADTIMSSGPNSNFIYRRDGTLLGSTARAGSTTYI